MERLMRVCQNGLCPVSGSGSINMAIIIQISADGFLTVSNNVSQSIFVHVAQFPEPADQIVKDKKKNEFIKDE